MNVATKISSRYELIQKLSLSNSQAVGRQTFLAQDLQTHKRVVVKIIQPEQIAHFHEQWQNLKLFEREREILATLKHPALPQYKDAFEADIEGVHSFVLVQTYCQAPSLATLIRSGRRFSEATVIELAERLLSILSYLHTQTPPVIHRDIKPSNILVGAQGEVYLIDFGAVHTDLTKESGTITIVGSYGYIPLEQFSGHAVPASDLYSLGMTLIYLVTGTHPADMAFVEGTIQLPYCALNPSLNPSMVQWLKRMSAQNIQQRFRTADQALRSLPLRQSSPKRALPPTEISPGYHLSLRPKHTKIMLRRDCNHIRITVPQPRQRLSMEIKIGMNIWAVLKFLDLIGLILLAIPAILILIWPLILVVNALVDRIFQWLQIPSRQIIVEIDRAQGIRTGSRSLPSTAVTWHPLTSQFQEIDLVAYTPGYQSGSYKLGIKTISHRKTSPALSVHAGRSAYTIGHNQLSATELWWLGQELSDFLTLELQTIHPMPAVKVRSD